MHLLLCHEGKGQVFGNGTRRPHTQQIGHEQFVGDGIACLQGTHGVVVLVVVVVVIVGILVRSVGMYGTTVPTHRRWFGKGQYIRRSIKGGTQGCFGKGCKIIQNGLLGGGIRGWITEGRQRLIAANLCIIRRCMFGWLIPRRGSTHFQHVAPLAACVMLLLLFRPLFGGKEIRNALLGFIAMTATRTSSSTIWYRQFRCPQQVFLLHTAAIAAE